MENIQKNRRWKITSCFNSIELLLLIAQKSEVLHQIHFNIFIVLTPKQADRFPSS